MKKSDRDMLDTFLDMTKIRPVGEPLRPITSKTQDVVGNRRQRRALAAVKRRKKK